MHCQTVPLSSSFDMNPINDLGSMPPAAVSIDDEEAVAQTTGKKSHFGTRDREFNVSCFDGRYKCEEKLSQTLN